MADRVAGELGIWTEVYSELLPADKVAKVEELIWKKSEPGKKSWPSWADGIDDAPVLGRADIGIAMGAMGSDAAIEAADVVLMDDDPLQIAEGHQNFPEVPGDRVPEHRYLPSGIKLICLALGALGIANMWLAIFADVGVMILAVLNAIRALFAEEKYRVIARIVERRGRLIARG